jgi:uncharacterized membrane protein YkoI
MISMAGGATHHLRQVPLLAKSEIPAANLIPGAPDLEAIMSIERIAALLMFSSLSVLPMPALAHESDGAAKPAPAQDVSESERTAIFQEIKVFANVQISVRDVIKIAEGRVSGAKVVDISFDGGGGRLAYNLLTYLNDEISAVTIDASTGKTIGDALVTPVSALHAKDRIELAGFNTAVIDLSDVVPIAEAYGSGKAVSVGLDEENGKLIFLVVVVTDGSLKQISVDPNQQNQLRNASFGKKH